MEMNQVDREEGAAGGWAGWLFARLRGRSHPQPRLALVERITLAPRQSLSLIEAEGRRILVATSAEGASAFYALDEGMPLKARARRDPTCHPANQPATGISSRISW